MKGYAAILLAAVIAFAVSSLLGFVIIPWLHKLKFGQTILDIGPKWHKKKQGTPTMGGFLFIIGILVAVVVVLLTDFLLDGDIVLGEAVTEASVKVKFYAGILMALCYGLVGFADDYIKVAKKRNLGLTIRQKSIMQILIMAVYLGTMYAAGATYVFLPFIGNVDFGWFFFVFGVAAMYCTVNAVNFTDGVDGLCSSVTATAALSLCIIAVLRHNFGIGFLSAALLGGVCGFLIWNHNPARVMMGDLGSMFLGGLILAITYAMDVPWVILLSGLVYVIEFLSDIIQITYFKATHGKRIFKMAPIHHHFELCGWSEKKICIVFSVVNLCGGLLAVLLVAFGNLR